VGDGELRKWVDDWSGRYPTSYDAQLDGLAGMDTFGPDDVARVYQWKYRGLWPGRKIEAMRAFSGGLIASLTHRAFSNADDLAALTILMLIPGAQAAGASAILMARDPLRFTVMDSRAIKSLIYLSRWSQKNRAHWRPL
jgi:hypothetical protein